MRRYLAIGIVDKIYIEKDKEFEIEEEKQKFLQAINETIDLSYYEGEEDVSKKSWLFTLKKEVFEQNIHTFIKDVYPIIFSQRDSEYVDWENFHQKNYPIHLGEKKSKITGQLKRGIETPNQFYYCDDFWPNRNFTYIFLNQRYEHHYDLSIYPSFFLIWMNYDKVFLEDDDDILFYLNYFSRQTYKSPLGKCFLFYIVNI